MLVQQLLIPLAFLLSVATNRVYSQQEPDCSKPKDDCLSLKLAEDCLKWNGCIWKSFDPDGVQCVSTSACNTEAAVAEAEETSSIDIDGEQRKKKKTKSPTEYPTLTNAPTASPTKYPSVIETMPPTGSPVPGMCKFPIKTTCPNLNDASNCVAFSGCFWNNIIKKCANKPECSKTAFPTRRPTEASDCVTPIGSTCTAITRDGVCNSYSGCIWVVGTGCVNKPECSKTAFPTPAGGTRSPTSRPSGAMTPSPTAPTNSPYRATTPTSRSPTNKPTTRIPTKKPTTGTPTLVTKSPTVFPTNKSITSAPSYTPTKAFSEQDCSRFSGSKATCLLIIYCKWCPSCSRPNRCQHV